jgi:hypothetical protein
MQLSSPGWPGHHPSASIPDLDPNSAVPRSRHNSDATTKRRSARIHRQVLSCILFGSSAAKPTPTVDLILNRFFPTRKWVPLDLARAWSLRMHCRCEGCRTAALAGDPPRARLAGAGQGSGLETASGSGSGLRAVHGLRAAVLAGSEPRPLCGDRPAWESPLRLRRADLQAGAQSRPYPLSCLTLRGGVHNIRPPERPATISSDSAPQSPSPQGP